MISGQVVCQTNIQMYTQHQTGWDCVWTFAVIELAELAQGATARFTSEVTNTILKAVLAL